MMKNFLILAVSLMMLGACGVKPGSVEPPVGAENSGFPHTYPDVSTDPNRTGRPGL